MGPEAALRDERIALAARQSLICESVLIYPDTPAWPALTWRMPPFEDTAQTGYSWQPCFPTSAGVSAAGPAMKAARASQRGAVWECYPSHFQRVVSSTKLPQSISSPAVDAAPFRMQDPNVFSLGQSAWIAFKESMQSSADQNASAFVRGPPAALNHQTPSRAHELGTDVGHQIIRGRPMPPEVQGVMTQAGTLTTQVPASSNTGMPMPFVADGGSINTWNYPKWPGKRAALGTRYPGGLLQANCVKEDSEPLHDAVSSFDLAGQMEPVSIGAEDAGQQENGCVLKPAEHPAHERLCPIEVSRRQTPSTTASDDPPEESSPNKTGWQCHTAANTSREALDTTGMPPGASRPLANHEAGHLEGGALFASIEQARQAQMTTPDPPQQRLNKSASSLYRDMTHAHANSIAAAPRDSLTTAALLSPEATLSSNSLPHLLNNFMEPSSALVDTEQDGTFCSNISHAEAAAVTEPSPPWDRAAPGHDSHQEMAHSDVQLGKDLPGQSNGPALSLGVRGEEVVSSLAARRYSEVISEDGDSEADVVMQ